MGIAGAIVGASVLGAGAQIIGGNSAANAQKDAAAASNATQLQMYNQTRADQAPYRSVGYGALNKLAAMYGVTSTNDDGTAKPAEQDWTGYYNANPDLVTAFTTGKFSNGDTLDRGQFSTPEALAQWHYQNYGQAEGRKAPGTVAPTTGAADNTYGGFTESPGYQYRIDQATKAIQNSAASRGLLKSGATVKAINTAVQGEASNEFNNYSNRLAALAGVGQTATSTTGAAGQNYANNVSNAQMAAGNATASAYQNTGNAISGGLQNAASGYLYNKGYSGGGGVTGNYGVSNYFSPSSSLAGSVANTIGTSGGVLYNGGTIF